MSAIDTSSSTSPAPRDDAERGVFALLALIQDPDGFAERLRQFATARDEAVRRLDAAMAHEADARALADEAKTLKTQAEETLATYRRELDDLARKRDEVERIQNDLFQARAKMEADATEARREVMAKASITRYRNAGDACVLHRHARWHLMECKRGRITVELWDPDDAGPHALHQLGHLDGYLEVPAGWMHQVTAGQDDCWTACIFDLFDEEGRLLADPKADFTPGTEVFS